MREYAVLARLAAVGSLLVLRKEVEVAPESVEREMSPRLPRAQLASPGATSKPKSGGAMLVAQALTPETTHAALAPVAPRYWMVQVDDSRSTVPPALEGNCASVQVV